MITDNFNKFLPNGTAPPSGDSKPTVKAKPKQVLYRVNEIVQPNGQYPISASSWWAGVRSGYYPQPIKLGPRITVWRAEDLEQLAKHGVQEGNFRSMYSSDTGEKDHD